MVDDVEKGKHLIPQFRQVLLYRLPDDRQVDFEVVVNHAIAHPVHYSPGNLGMLRRKLRVGGSHFIRRLANYLDTTDYGILGPGVSGEGLEVHAGDVTQSTVGCIQ